MDTSAGGLYSYPVMSYPATGSSTGSGSSQSSSQQSTQVLPQLQADYASLLAENNQRYATMLGAYQQGQSNLAGSLPQINAGYGAVGNQVQNTLGMGQVLGGNGNWGVAGPAAQAIGQTEQAQQAQNTQQVANQGLGNTTAAENLNAGAAAQAQYAYGALGANLANTAAGYQSSIGQAGLGARMQGLGMQTQLTQGALANLEQPSSNTFGALTGGFGQSQSSSVNSQQSQNQGGSQGGGQGGGGNPAAGVAGAPGGPAGGVAGGYVPGNSAAVGAGGGYGGGVAGVSGYGNPGGTAVSTTTPGVPGNLGQAAGVAGGGALAASLTNGGNYAALGTNTAAAGGAAAAAAAGQQGQPQDSGPPAPQEPGPVDANGNPSSNLVEGDQALQAGLADGSIAQSDVSNLNNLINNNANMEQALQNSGISASQLLQQVKSGQFPMISFGPNGPSISGWDAGGIGSGAWAAAVAAKGS